MNFSIASIPSFGIGPNNPIYHLRCADDTTLMSEHEEELKSLLRRVKEESEKACLKLNILKTKTMTSSPLLLDK